MIDATLNDIFYTVGAFFVITWFMLYALAADIEKVLKQQDALRRQISSTTRARQ